MKMISVKDKSIEGLEKKITSLQKDGWERVDNSFKCDASGAQSWWVINMKKESL